MNGKNKVMCEEVDPNYIETFPELIKSLRTAGKRHTKKQYSKVPVAFLEGELETEIAETFLQIANRVEKTWKKFIGGDFRESLRRILDVSRGINLSRDEMKPLADELDKARKLDCGSIVKGYWINGPENEYEFAYCSECDHMQWAGWDSHAEAKEKIGDFYKEYRYCPHCGAKMKGGLYA